MVVFYDFEVEFQNQPDKIKELYEGGLDIIFRKVKEFVRQRLSVLEDEIEKEKGYVYIKTGGYPFKLCFRDVSDNLKAKMEQSLSKSDFDFLSRSIWEELYPGIMPPTN